ncbi:hypothetical protein ACJ72_05329 [Emergomyces africanus]|uniref:Uncharacterized protein n=1 Tax=Emergomyces africanus TaxID=1955775 RepID=A0A1B7NUC3_9EURO|nr:hypothetical protein ACJ72_05329 [Emergomyces africanus]
MAAERVAMGNGTTGVGRGKSLTGPMPAKKARRVVFTIDQCTFIRTGALAVSASDAEERQKNNKRKYSSGSVLVGADEVESILMHAAIDFAFRCISCVYSVSQAPFERLHHGTNIIKHGNHPPSSFWLWRSLTTKSRSISPELDFYISNCANDIADSEDIDRKRQTPVSTNYLSTLALTIPNNVSSLLTKTALQVFHSASVSRGYLSESRRHGDQDKDVAMENGPVFNQVSPSMVAKRNIQFSQPCKDGSSVLDPLTCANSPQIGL